MAIAQHLHVSHHANADFITIFVTLSNTWRGEIIAGRLFTFCMQFVKLMADRRLFIKGLIS